MRHRALGAFVGVDVRSVGREGLLVVVLASPLLLAVVLRIGYGPAESWVRVTYGLALAVHRPFILAAVVVLHLPLVYGMVGALLIFDDLDDGALRALRMTPFTLERYLAYRLATAGMVSLVALLVAVPVSGLAPWQRLGWLLPALALAAACAPLVMLAALAVSGNKIEGLTALKALGIPVMVPLAAWFIGFPWEVALMPLPTYWPVRALWAGVEGAFDMLAVAIGVAVIAAVGSGLLRRVRRRMTTRT